jgi:hypothetical protein
MRRNRIHVNFGTYFRALVQFERRMVSRMDMMKADIDCAEPSAFGGLAFPCFLVITR